MTPSGGRNKSPRRRRGGPGTVPIKIGRLVLAGIFATAGVGKVLEPQTTTKMVKDFGVPERAVSPVVKLLPCIELTAACCLLMKNLSRLGSWLALFLLSSFSIAAVFAQIHGKAPQCACFGSRFSVPIGAPFYVRNTLLAALALTTGLLEEPDVAAD